MRDCFDAVRRQLEDHARRQRGDIKAHEVPGHGRIANLIAEKHYGFIDAGDGTEVYFHRNAVEDEGFDKLAVGDEVRFAIHPGEGEKGPQAGEQGRSDRNASSTAGKAVMYLAGIVTRI